MKTLDEQADDLLHEWAKEKGISLRKDGIIDDRRQRTVREREVCFSSFFAGRKKARGHSE